MNCGTMFALSFSLLLELSYKWKHMILLCFDFDISLSISDSWDIFSQMILTMYVLSIASHSPTSPYNCPCAHDAIQRIIIKLPGLTHDAHTPGIAPWSLFTHHWSGGPAGGWGGEVGSTQPHCSMPLYARHSNFGKNACINTVEILISYAFFQRLPLCNCISISYTSIKCY